MGPIAFFRAQLISLLLEALLFGCFSILCPISLWMLVYKHRRHGSGYTRLGKWLFAMVTVMYLLAMTHLVLVAFNVIVMFANHSTVPDGPFLFFVSGGEDSTTLATVYLLAALSFVGDSFMTYRVFVIWGRSRKSIILPSLLMLGTFVTVVLMEAGSKSSGLDVAEGLYADGAFTLLTTYWALTLATNVSHLALIVGRLMWHERSARMYCADVPQAGPSMRWRVARTIIQSEAVYSVTVLATLVLSLTSFPAFFVATNVLPSLVGISFTLIITHVGFDEIKDQLERADDMAHDVSLRFAPVDSFTKGSLTPVTPSMISTCDTADQEVEEALERDATQDPSLYAPTVRGRADPTPATWA